MKYNEYSLADLVTIKYGKNQKKFCPTMERFRFMAQVDLWVMPQNLCMIDLRF